jgi:hypothetical protein
MVSGWMMKTLLVIYVVIMITAAIEKRWYLALYWFAAGLLMISILKGMK